MLKVEKECKGAVFGFLDTGGKTGQIIRSFLEIPIIEIVLFLEEMLERRSLRDACIGLEIRTDGIVTHTSTVIIPLERCAVFRA